MSFKGAVSRVVELNQFMLMPISNVKTLLSSKSDVDRQTDKLTTVTLSHMHAESE